MKKILLIIIFVAVVFGGFSFAKADLPSWLTNPLGTVGAPSGAISSIGSGIELIINGIIAVVQIIFIILVLVGGIMYLTSAGNEDQAKRSRTLLISAVVGLVITLAAWTVSTWVLNTLNKGEVTPIISPK